LQNNVTPQQFSFFGVLSQFLTTFENGYDSDPLLMH